MAALKPRSKCGFYPFLLCLNPKFGFEPPIDSKIEQKLPDFRTSLQGVQGVVKYLCGAQLCLVLVHKTNKLKLASSDSTGSIASKDSSSASAIWGLSKPNCRNDRDYFYLSLSSILLSLGLSLGTIGYEYDSRV